MKHIFVLLFSLLSFICEAQTLQLTPQVAKKFNKIMMWDGHSKNAYDKSDMGEFKIVPNNISVPGYGNSDLLEISFKRGSNPIFIPVKEATYQLLGNGIQITYPAQVNGYSNTLQVTASDNFITFNLLSSATTTPVLTETIKQFYVMEIGNGNFRDYQTTNPTDMIEIFTKFVKKKLKKG